MKKKEFKTIAKAYLSSLGFNVLEIEEIQGVLTPDCEVIGKNDKYTIELKEKGDEPREIAEDDKILSRGDFLTKEIPIGLRNTLKGIIDDGVKQIRQHDPDGKTFRIIWLHSAGRDPYLHYTRFHATLFGIGHMFSIRPKPCGLTCYYFNESAFFSWRNHLDGAILSYNDKAQLCINSLSRRVDEFRKSEIVFSMRNGLCDPQKEELNDPSVMIADCAIDRKSSRQVINYLQEKYDLEHLRSIEMNQVACTKLVDD